MEGSTIDYPWHNHVSVRVAGVVLAGRMCLETREGTRVLLPGELFALPPYRAHRMSAQEPYTLLTLCACGGGGSRPEDWASLAAREMEYPDAEIWLPRLAAALERLDEEPLRERWIDAVCRDVARRPQEETSVRCMAWRAALSPYEFSRRFKREVGLTPHGFLVQNRVRLAQRMIREGRATLTQTALDAGFCDQSHLIRQFERQVGLSPGEYRDACGARRVTRGRA